MKTRKSTVLLLLVVVPVFALAGFFIAQWLDQSATDPTMMADASTYRSGPFQVAVSINPTAPEVGENQFSVRVQDLQGNPVSGASIKAYGEMAAMATMAAMRAPADLEEVEPGLYTGPLTLEMGGEWPLNLLISKEGLGETRLGFDMATGRPGLSISSGGTLINNRNMSGDAMQMAEQAPEADAQGFYTVGKYRLKVDSTADGGTITAGDNPLRVIVRDSEGAPVNDASVRIVAQRLDAQGEALAHSPVAQLQAAGQGRYKGELSIEQAGEYSLAVDVSTEALGHGDLILGFTTGAAGLMAGSATPEGISHYTCSMHPSVKEAAPGSCPICSMDLIPVTHEAIASGTITVDNRRRQMIGVKTAAVTHQDLTKTIRAVGRIAYDERSISNVSLKFDAWIGELKADSVGAPVQRGQLLFTVYSPALLAAQQEYLETRQRLERRGPDNSLVQAARQRLMLWDISPAQIKQLEQRGKPLEYLPIFAPNSGTVVEKMVVAGSHMMTGSTLLRIADLSTVWVDAEIYEADLPLIREGMAATVSLPYLPGEAIEATVDYLYPYLEGKTRTARIRLVLDNADGRLKPDMYAEVTLKADLGHRLVVPEEAVLVAGESRVVFVDLGEGKLKPMRVTTGQRVGGWIEINDGLKLGDTVVTSGNFLIAAEAKLKTGIDQW